MREGEARVISQLIFEKENSPQKRAGVFSKSTVWTRGRMRPDLLPCFIIPGWHYWAFIDQKAESFPFTLDLGYIKDPHHSYKVCEHGIDILNKSHTSHNYSSCHSVMMKGKTDSNIHLNPLAFSGGAAPTTARTLKPNGKTHRSPPSSWAKILSPKTRSIQRTITTKTNFPICGIEYVSN